jgi:hypothetical protein
MFIHIMKNVITLGTWKLILWDTRTRLSKTYSTGTNGIPTHISIVSLLCRAVRIGYNRMKNNRIVEGWAQ